MSEKNLYENEDHIWKIRMQTLMKMKRNLEIAQIIDDSLYQYYTVERDLPVPNWRYIKDADWWMQYLKDMGIDPRNP
tara:strand:- start:328 stop:558 length:231 start_codon:yes stop_codon:yes gene_type:complete